MFACGGVWDEAAGSAFDFEFDYFPDFNLYATCEIVWKSGVDGGGSFGSEFCSGAGVVIFVIFADWRDGGDGEFGGVWSGCGSAEDVEAIDSGFHELNLIGWVLICSSIFLPYYTNYATNPSLYVYF